MSSKTRSLEDLYAALPRYDLYVAAAMPPTAMYRGPRGVYYTHAVNAGDPAPPDTVLVAKQVRVSKTSDVPWTQRATFCAADDRAVNADGECPVGMGPHGTLNELRQATKELYAPGADTAAIQARIETLRQEYVTRAPVCCRRVDVAMTAGDARAILADTRLTSDEQDKLMVGFEQSQTVLANEMASAPVDDPYFMTLFTQWCVSMQVAVTSVLEWVATKLPTSPPELSTAWPKQLRDIDALAGVQWLADKTADLWSSIREFGAWLKAKAFAWVAWLQHHPALIAIYLFVFKALYTVLCRTMRRKCLLDEDCRLIFKNPAPPADMASFLKTHGVSVQTAVLRALETVIQERVPSVVHLAKQTFTVFGFVWVLAPVNALFWNVLGDVTRDAFFDVISQFTVSDAGVLWVSLMVNRCIVKPKRVTELGTM